MKDPHDPYTQEIPPLVQKRKRGPGRPSQNPLGAKSGAQRAKEYRERKLREGSKTFTPMVSVATVQRIDEMRMPADETQGEFLDRLVGEEWARFQKKGKK